MSILSNKEELNSLKEELSTLKKNVEILNEKINNISTQNTELEEFIKKAIQTIIGNQIKVDNKIVQCREDYLVPIKRYVENAAQWIYEVKETIEK